MSTVTNSSADASVKTGVSPARKKFSTGLLIVALVVLAIEARSGLGQLLSGKALAARSFEGGFENVSFAEASSLVSLFPSVSVHADNPDETVYRYTWFSLLKSIAKKPVPELFIVASKADPPQAVAYFTDREEASLMYGGDSDSGDVTEAQGVVCPVDEEANNASAPASPNAAPAVASENTLAPLPATSTDGKPGEAAPVEANTKADGTTTAP